MITGIGIDTVKIIRFKHWINYPKKSLQRIFSNQEIAYCLSVPIKSAERFAVRFAAREALYKSLCSSYPNMHFSFLSIIKAITISQAANGSPIITVNWELITANNLPHTRIHISMSHTNTDATAIIIIEKKLQ
jgi:holo-[acyl-carrier protein] synthase